MDRSTNRRRLAQVIGMLSILSTLMYLLASPRPIAAQGVALDNGHCMASTGKTVFAYWNFAAGQNGDQGIIQLVGGGMAHGILRDVDLVADWSEEVEALEFDAEGGQAGAGGRGAGGEYGRLVHGDEAPGKEGEYFSTVLHHRVGVKPTTHPFCP